MCLFFYNQFSLDRTESPDLSVIKPFHQNEMLLLFRDNFCLFIINCEIEHRHKYSLIDFCFFVFLWGDFTELDKIMSKAVGSTVLRHNTEIKVLNQVLLFLFLYKLKENWHTFWTSVVIYWNSLLDRRSVSSVCESIVTFYNI